MFITIPLSKAGFEGTVNLYKKIRGEVGLEPFLGRWWFIAVYIIGFGLPTIYFSTALWSRPRATGAVATSRLVAHPTLPPPKTALGVPLT
jgi:hypothetical protein